MKLEDLKDVKDVKCPSGISKMPITCYCRCGYDSSVKEQIEVCKKVVAVYVRCANGSSVEEQIEACKNVVSDLDNVVIRVYSDINSSGVHWNRSALKALIKDVENGLIDKVVVTDVSRVSRSMIDFISFHRILSDNNVDLVTVDGSFGQNTLFNDCAVKIMERFQEYEKNVGGDYNG